jgi:hypothetical protein
MLREARLIRSSLIRSSRSCHDSVNPCLAWARSPTMVKLRDGQQHLPLCVGQFLSLVHDDVRERAGQQVRIGTGQCGLIDQGVLEVLAAQHRHQTYAVLVVRGLDQIVDDPGHLLAFSGDRGVMPALTS